MATFDYAEMQQTALELLTEFGNPFILKKPFGEPVYNPKTKKAEQKYTEYSGICVMKTYTAEAIGELSNIIQAGDVEFKCQLDNEKIVPKEKSDKIIFGNITYNIIEVATINPSGANIIIYTLHCQRAN